MSQNELTSAISACVKWCLRRERPTLCSPITNRRRMAKRVVIIRDSDALRRPKALKSVIGFMDYYQPEEVIHIGDVVD